MGATMMVERDLRPDGLDAQSARLAELVFHLTGCTADQAITAVGRPIGVDEPLERVARAIVRVRH
jgi:hypothetical protein